jgi:hypothetical protein
MKVEKIIDLKNVLLPILWRQMVFTREVNPSVKPTDHAVNLSTN